jgi:hypothetical protein
MSIVDKKKKVFGKIAAARTITEGIPKLKLTSSLSSVNNDGNPINFLTDLIKSLIGYEALISAVVDTLTHTLSKIEQDIKNALKVELKSIVSCGVDPHLPSWIQSTGTGIEIEVKKIDFMNILKIDPNSIAGSLLYSDITTPFTNSTDFNTFLYGVLQNDGVTYTWNNTLNIRFDSIGTLTRPNNTLTITSAPSYDNLTLTDLNNDYIDSLTLFNSSNGSVDIISRIIDNIYGSIASKIGKSLNQLESEARLNNIIDKMVNNVNKTSLNDDAFTFTNQETYENQLSALNRKKGATTLDVSTAVSSSVPLDYLNTLQTDIAASTNAIERKAVISSNLNNMANISVSNVTNQSDAESSKLNFIQRIINGMIKAIVNIVLSPKVVMAFIVNYKIVYGQSATYEDGVDFIKKNKNLMQNISKTIAKEIIQILLKIALKEISRLVAESISKKQKEKASLFLAQLQSLVGVPPNIINNLL